MALVVVNAEKMYIERLGCKSARCYLIIHAGRTQGESGRKNFLEQCCDFQRTVSCSS
jgi:hypothetical protein